MALQLLIGGFGLYGRSFLLFDTIALASGPTAWVTSLECISGDRYIITPMIIHRGTKPLTPIDM